MTAEQIERPDLLHSHWLHTQKAVSQFLMPGAQYTGHQYPQHSTITPSLPETITAKISYITSAFPADPWFSEKISLVKICYFMY
jgi:hypothetical protein